MNTELHPINRTLLRFRFALENVGTPYFNQMRLMEVDLMIYLAQQLVDEFNESETLRPIIQQAREIHQGWVDAYYVTFLWPESYGPELDTVYDFITTARGVLEDHEFHTYLEDAVTYLAKRPIYTLTFDL